MKVRYTADVKGFHGLLHGKVYNVIRKEKSWYRIIDESGEDYLYPPDLFEIIEGDKIMNADRFDYDAESL